MTVQVKESLGSFSPEEMAECAEGRHFYGEGSTVVGGLRSFVCSRCKEPELVQRASESSQ